MRKIVTLPFQMDFTKVQQKFIETFKFTKFFLKKYSLKNGDDCV